MAGAADLGEQWRADEAAASDPDAGDLAKPLGPAPRPTPPPALTPAAETIARPWHSFATSAGRTEHPEMRELTPARARGRRRHRGWAAC